MSDEGFLQPYMILDDCAGSAGTRGPVGPYSFSPSAGSTRRPAQRPREVTTPGPEGRGFPA